MIADGISPWAYAPATIAAAGAGIAAIIGAVKNNRDIAGVKKSLVKVEKTSEAIHTLSNSAMGAQLLTKVELLQMLAVQAHRLAEVTKEAADAAVAQSFEVQVAAAKKVYQDHLMQQAVVDARKE
jgi:hypothetical protein